MKLRQAILVVSGSLAIGLPSAAQEPSRYNNDPFTKPGIITPLTLPDAWPTNIHRNPHNVSPADTRTKLVVLGTGMPLPNPYRSGPGYALIVNDYPYLIDAGEGIWRSIARAALVNGDEFTRGLSPEKLKHVFITHLHEDHTVGIPSLLLNPFKLNIPTSKEIYGPNGIRDMVRYIVAAWQIDIAAELSDGYDPEGREQPDTRSTSKPQASFSKTPTLRSRRSGLSMVHSRIRSPTDSPQTIGWSRLPVMEGRIIEISSMRQ